MYRKQNRFCVCGESLDLWYFSLSVASLSHTSENYLEDHRHQLPTKPTMFPRVAFENYPELSRECMKHNCSSVGERTTKPQLPPPPLPPPAVRKVSSLFFFCPGENNKQKHHQSISSECCLSPTSFLFTPPSPAPPINPRSAKRWCERESIDRCRV